MTTIYLIRHSAKFDVFRKLGKFNSDDNNYGQYKYRCLSIEGEKRAEILGKEAELQKLDAVYCSTYVRAMETAKYLAEPQNLSLNVDKRFDEISEGDLESAVWNEGCDRQYIELDLKFPNGESHNEVFKRFDEGFWETVLENRGKRVAIVTHGCAMTCFMHPFVEFVEPVVEDSKWFKFKGKEVFKGKYDVPEVFKLTVDEKNKEILDIENIVFDDLTRRR